MRIKKMVSRNRRDFTAIYECEHCGHEVEDGGYDDSYFHNTIIPQKKCPKCGQTASDNYQPREPKYADWEIL